jgi:hypothetical protein
MLKHEIQHLIFRYIFDLCLLYFIILDNLQEISMKIVKVHSVNIPFTSDDEAIHMNMFDKNIFIWD